MDEMSSGKNKSLCSYRMMPTFNVIITGYLANWDIALAEALTRQGLECVVIRPREVELPDFGTLPARVDHFTADRVMRSRDKWWFYKICRRARCVVSLTSAVTGNLGSLWFLLPVLGFPPIVNVMTGSDFTELAVAPGLHGLIYRQLLRRAAFTVLAPYPKALENARKLRLTKFIVIRYPYMLPQRRAVGPPDSGPITYFHCSHLDWGETDNKPGRNSTKGNDRFLRAFMRAVRAGADIRCIILDRGSDRHVARRMIDESGVADRFEWRAEVTQREFTGLFGHADIVVDQFDVGGLGAIAVEAMALGKPVMIHLDTDCLSLVYDDPPPVLNWCSEEETFEAIMANQDREALRRLGDEAEAWVRLNHGSGLDMDEFVFRIALASGMEWPIRAHE